MAQGAVRARERELEFRQRVDEAKSRFLLSTVIGRATKLKRVGKEQVGLCFAHKEKTGSLSVNDALGVYFCRGCGATGDVIKAVMEIEHLDFRGALEWLGVAELPKADPARRVKAAKAEEEDGAGRTQEAVDLYRSTVELLGTIGETYLASRDITSWPGSIRFTPHAYLWLNRDTGEIGPEYPALVGLVQGDDGGATGIQRIFLRADGSGKADLNRPKMSLGRVRGGALRLGPATSTLYIAEGPEDGLSIRQEMGVSVWVALGTANMPNIRYPDIVRRIVICSQNDAAGERATQTAAKDLYDQGYEVEIRYPAPEYKDWNDQLRGIKRAMEAGAMTPEQGRAEWNARLSGGAR